MVMDSSDAEADFGWTPKVSLPETLGRIAAHAEQHPDWLERSGI
jgi:hypothetical protein